MLQLRQLTHGHYGHSLNRRQAVSPDGAWIVYDTRNDDTHISRTNAIEMVHVATGEIVRLYQTKKQSQHGPGVGAAAFHPTQSRVCFIHGIESSSAENPYSGSRRFGAIVDVEKPGMFIHAESRHIGRPIYGVLAGGTHAHSWNASSAISFTYNDFILEQSAKVTPAIRDLRSVGFMVPGKLEIEGFISTDESFIGSYIAFLAAHLTPKATQGSDEIEQATEESWCGSQALVFQGAVRDDHGQIVQEIYRTELPSDAQLKSYVGQEPSLNDQPYRGLTPFPGCKQTRLTRTVHRKYPGVQGPRNWLVCSPDGANVFFPVRDELGIVQIGKVKSSGGEPQIVTQFDQSIEGQITIDRAGRKCAVIVDQRICVIDLPSGSASWVTNKQDAPIIGAPHFLENDRFAVNAYVGQEPTRYLQIFVAE
jgi:hypothetical protein